MLDSTDLFQETEPRRLAPVDALEGADFFASSEYGRRLPLCPMQLRDIAEDHRAGWLQRCNKHIPPVN